MTVYQLRDPEYVDLAFNPNQPRDAKGRWTGGAPSVLGVRDLDMFAEPKFEDREVFREQAKSIIQAARIGGGKEKDKAQVKVWEVSHEERQAMLEDTEDPLPDTSDADLFKYLHGSDPEERERAMQSLNARRERYEFLAEAAHNGLRTAKAKETVAKWDSRMERLPGGKGFLKLRDRILTERHVIGTSRKIEKSKEFFKESGVHLAVGTALVGLASGLAGLYSLKYGGDPSAFEHAKHAIEGWMHGGPTVGTVPVMEAVSWVGVQTLIVGVGRKAARANPWQLWKARRNAK